MFRLTKWYLDLVTEQGTALITYAAALEWSGLRVHYVSILLARPGIPPEEHSTWSDVRLPQPDGDTLRFRHAGLPLDGEWRREAAPLDATLLDSPSGRLHWSCLQPSAAATLEFSGETFTGRGYAECLVMTCLPWTLPFRSLRWGRFASASSSVVWIDWNGEQPRRWVWLDGAAEPGAVLQGGGIAGLSGGRRLRLVPVRELCDRRSLQVISRRLPALDALPAGPIRNLREAKRLDRGILYREQVPVSEGWTIHEVVTW
ncbi:MAG: hypothetical protein AB7Q69_17590 [Gemmatimonadales bacterium]